MNVSDNIRFLRTDKEMTQQGLALALGVSAVTVSNWESGVKNPSTSALIAISDLFGVSVDWLLGLAPGRALPDGVVYTRRERRLLSDFRSLDEYGKKAVEAVCGAEKTRCGDSRGESVSREKTRFIPRYLNPSAAGIGMPLTDGVDFDMIPVEDGVPADADFAVVISGSSMSPEIKDGSTVYVRRTESLSPGDIGIWSVDGAMYCKQYYRNDETGGITLVSLNRKYKNTNIEIGVESNSSIVCYGKVLLDRRVPFPEYFTEG